MNIEEISRTLPNGFDDTAILNINIDYLKQTITFLIDVDFSSPSEDVEEPRRRGILKVTDFIYFVIEPPVESYSYNPLYCEDVLWIGSESSDFSKSKLETNPIAKILPSTLPETAFKHWFYITSRNCLIYVAGMSADLEWITN